MPKKLTKDESVNSHFQDFDESYMCPLSTASGIFFCDCKEKRISFSFDCASMSKKDAEDGFKFECPVRLKIGQNTGEST